VSEPAPLATLSPLEAAIHLGITPELLFGYTRHTFCKSQAQRRRLRTVNVEGATCFGRDELDSFDCYLREPWVDTGDQRVSQPNSSPMRATPSCQNPLLTLASSSSGIVKSLGSVYVRAPKSFSHRRNLNPLPLRQPWSFFTEMRSYCVARSGLGSSSKT